MSNTFDAVYALVRRIPAGRVASYGQIACLMGNPRLARVVGYAMSAARDDSIPCHRVVNRQGGLAASFGLGGREEQRLLLEMEGVEFTPDGRVDMARFGWDGR